MASTKRGGRSTAAAKAAGGGGGGGGVRDRILDAAIAILRESGLQCFTQVQVAERAGVRQSHLTYYFPTREDLLEAVTARAVEGIARGVQPAAGAQGGRDPGPLLARLTASVVAPEHMRMFLGLIVEADGDPGLRAMLVGGTQRMEAVLADALGGDDAGEARERARLVLAALWGLGLYHFVVRPPSRSDPTGPYLSWVAAAAAAAAEAPAGRSTAGQRDPSTRE
ncbi:MAG TPA: TetR/AcrR family transcriptional regulator [Gemmatimonadaceae bacterium]|nr:TetR/AcrR family transcriptional regulator [Gemmatimonadaceae bacterium]